MRCTGIWPSEIIWKRASHLRSFPVCFQSVERTIYRRMERCRLRALNSRNISDDELDRNVTETAKDENKCWNFFTKKEASKECHENWFRTSDLKTPKIQTFIANSSQFVSPNVLWSRNVQMQQPERIGIFIFSGLSLSHRSLKQWKPNKVDDVCWRIFLPKK